MKHEDEVKQVKEWVSESERTLNRMLKDKANIERSIDYQKEHIANYKKILGHLGECDCRYSKEMNQSSPRLCVDCGKPEEMAFVQTPLRLGYPQETIPSPPPPPAERELREGEVPRKPKDNDN